MNFNRIAELIIKLFGVSFLTACLADVTYLPHYIMLSSYSHQSNLPTAAGRDYDLQLVMICVRGLLYLGLGMGLIAGWKRILHLLIGEVADPGDRSYPAG